MRESVYSSSMDTHLLIVRSTLISFGCIAANDLGGHCATIVLYEDLLHRYVDIVPARGDMLLCRNLHSSVFAPICRIRQSALCLRSLPLVPDVLNWYFPLFESMSYDGRVSAMDRRCPYL